MFNASFILLMACATKGFGFRHSSRPRVRENATRSGKGAFAISMRLSSAGRARLKGMLSVISLETGPAARLIPVDCGMDSENEFSSAGACAAGTLREGHGSVAIGGLAVWAGWPRSCKIDLSLREARILKGMARFSATRVCIFFL
jgi:hypothetical protein